MGLRRSPISENAETALTSWTADSNVTALRGGLSRGKWTNSEQVEICKPSIPLLEITIWLNHEQKISWTCLKFQCVKFRLSCCSHWWPPSLRARQVALVEGWWPLSIYPTPLPRPPFFMFSKPPENTKTSPKVRHTSNQKNWVQWVLPLQILIWPRVAIFEGWPKSISRIAPNLTSPGVWLALSATSSGSPTKVPL